jgi:hypothetical protein
MDAERSLRVLHAQAELELGEAAVAFSARNARHANALQELRQIEALNDMSRQEMRRLAGMPLIDPTLHDAVRRMLAAGRERLPASRQSLEQAAQRLEVARAELGRCRQRGSDLGRAVASEHGKVALAREARDESIVGDLWLQANWVRP